MSAQQGRGGVVLRILSKLVQPSGPICRTSRAAHLRGNRSTWGIDSILGELLSPALLLVLGVCPLFLSQQLCHGGLWRRSPTVKLAHAGAAREHHWGLDVRNIREHFVCDSDPAG